VIDFSKRSEDFYVTHKTERLEIKKIGNILEPLIHKEESVKYVPTNSAHHEYIFFGIIMG
jgi:hypothetical protein